MTFKAFPGLLGVVLLGSGVASGVELKLKWEEGKRYVFVEEMSSAMTMEMGGMAMATKSDMRQEMHYAVSPHEKGQEVKMSVDAIKMNVAMNGQEMMAFDSEGENQEGQVSAMLRPLLDLEASIIYDGNGTVLEVTGMEGLDGLEQVGMGKEELEQMARQASMLLPGKNVEPGDTWTAELNMPMGQLSKKPATMTFDMSYEGMEEKGGKKLAKIVMSGKLDMEAGAEMPFELSSKKLAGTMLFDTELGQPRETKMQMELELGLPEGVPVQEGAPGKMPMTVMSSQTLKSVEVAK